MVTDSADVSGPTLHSIWNCTTTGSNQTNSNQTFTHSTAEHSYKVGRVVTIVNAIPSISAGGMVAQPESPAQIANTQTLTAIGVGNVSENVAQSNSSTEESANETEAVNHTSSEKVEPSRQVRPITLYASTFANQLNLLLSAYTV